MSNDISLPGLARQMVLAGLIDEKTAQQAQQQAQRNQTPLVTWLVQNKLVKSRALAELAAEQF
ncbi:type IV-A pilus assembly ATPase PilB, partial [Azotobacter chroococcum]|nr:type IV-A pilus assembly ATPase PilB [Azotobacter chroococcum]